MREWNGYLEIFSRPQVIENSREYFLLRTDILHKTVVGCPYSVPHKRRDMDHSYILSDFRSHQIKLDSEFLWAENLFWAFFFFMPKTCFFETFCAFECCKSCHKWIDNFKFTVIPCPLSIIASCKLFSTFLSK